MDSAHGTAAMIDPADKQTEELPLEQLPGNISNATGVTGMPDSDQAGVEHALCPTRRNPRGRPRTGKAMTPAEKQRAYRQRLAEQRANQVPAKWHKEMKSAADEGIEQLEQQLADARKDLALKQTQLAYWIERAEAAERELESRDGKSFWNVESCPKGKRTWSVIGGEGDPFESREKAEAFAERLRSDKSAMAEGWKYRVVQAKAPK